MLNMCDVFEDDYKEFVIGELTELWDSYSINRESRIDVIGLYYYTVFRKKHPLTFSFISP